MTGINLHNIKKAYFIGIGGIGMSAVARMLIHEGKEVFGSDLGASKITDELIALGAHIQIGAPKEDLPDGIDVVIYTVAISDTHPELVSAKEKNISAISYPESLALISKDKFTIAIAGTHGKTTTTAMVAQILIEAGLDPTVIVGSLLKQGTNFIAGKSKYFVVEACEYKRSFLNIRADIAVITNIDDDHLDYYKNLEGIQKGFSEFIHLIKKGGTLVTNPRDKNIRPILADFDRTVFDYSSVNEEISLKVPGQHNIKNAKAAFLVAEQLGVPKDKILSGLAHFAGTWRRFEEIGKTKEGAIVYDDYGHHPTEIRATLEAARDKFPKQRIFVAYQPHLYSRTKEHFNEFGEAFAPADEILLLPIYAAREPHDPSISSEILAAEIKKKGKNIGAYQSFTAAAEYLHKNLKTGDVVLTMGAGDINTLAKILVS